MPVDAVPPDIIAAILKGGAATLREAHCALAGGHSIRNPEPFYGLAVTGTVSPRRLITNAAGCPGDLLVLTKPLGTGIVTTGLKRRIASPAIVRRAVKVMRQLNVAGADLAESSLVRAGTDVTGFGLLGHLGSLCRASGVGAELQASRVPVLGREVWSLLQQDCVPGGTRLNLEFAARNTDFGPDVSSAWRLLLADAQTSGGLLLCVPPRRLTEVLRVLRQAKASCAATIGRLTPSRRARIVVQA